MKPTAPSARENGGAFAFVGNLVLGTGFAWLGAAAYACRYAASWGWRIDSVKRSMKLRHPYEWLSETAQKRAFVVLLVLTVVVMVSLQVLGGPLKTEAAPSGIVSFEFAGEQSQAKAIVESWGARGQVYAGLNLGLDYLFLVAYGSSIGLGCVLVAQSLAKQAAILYSAGVVLARKTSP